MKVHELIEQLQKYDGELEVNIDLCLDKYDFHILPIDGIDGDYDEVVIYVKSTMDIINPLPLTEEEKQADREALQKAIDNPGRIFNLSRGATVKTY